MSDTTEIWSAAHQALEEAQRLLPSEPSAAERVARSVLRHDPRSAEAHRVLGMALRRLGRSDEARLAEDGAIGLAMLHPELAEAAIALRDLHLNDAERLLRSHLKKQPDDAAALRMLAEIAARSGHFAAAEQLVENALAIAPQFAAGHALLAAIRRVRLRNAYWDRNELPSGGDPVAPLSADQIYADGLALYEQAVEEQPEGYENWLNYGYTLRVVGRQDDALGKFRQAIAIEPGKGEAWWAIADLKSSNFTRDDVATLRRLIGSSEGSASDLAQLHFALGRALEQFGDPENAFQAFQEGNRIRFRSSKHDPDAVTRHVDRSIEMFDRRFFDRRSDSGDQAVDPIFVLGMPRSGSTLIEQILSSHPLIEGVSELADLSSIANRLAGFRQAGLEDSPYLDNFSNLSGPELQKLGRRYLWNSGLHRRTMRPYFVDKMPNNWLHVGLIRAILPNARIIDARRHPLDCCMSNYRQFFASGQEFSYDLGQLGRFYADCNRLLSHFETIAPRNVIRVELERLVDDPDTEIRRVFSFLEIPFDDRTLRFHENKRPVATASAEQVRRPLNRTGFGQWVAYDPWIAPLKRSLGQLVDDN